MGQVKKMCGYCRRASFQVLFFTLTIILFFCFQSLVFASSPSPDRKVPTQEFMTNPEGYNSAMWEMVRLATKEWEDNLGVPFEMDVLDHDQLNSEGLFGGNFDVRIQYFSGIPARLDPGFMLTSRFYATCENYFPQISEEKCPEGGGPFNSMGYFSPEFNKLMDKQRSIFEYEDRKKVINKAIEMTVADRPTLVLFSPNMLHIMSTKNWKEPKPTTGEGLSSFWNSLEIKPIGNDKSLKVGSLYVVPMLNPLGVMTAQGYRVARLIYDRLYRIDTSGKPTKWMAEEMSVSEGPNGPNTQITIKIREDMNFHDGEHVTAEDVKFTMDFAKKYKAPDLSQYLKRVTDVKQIDDYTIQIDLDSAWSAITHVLFSRMLIIPKHIWQDVPEEVENPIEWANRNPIGSGPFEFGSWQRGEQLILNKNTNYFHSIEPDRLVRVKFGSNEFLSKAIQRAEIDIQWGEPMPSEIGTRAAKHPNVKLIEAPNHGHLVFDLRVAKPPYNDPNFRKALEYCIPREKMIDEIYDGFATKAVSTLPPANKAWHNPKVFDRAVPYDPEKGRQILQDAGYEWDDDGRLYYPSE